MKRTVLLPGLLAVAVVTAGCSSTASRISDQQAAFDHYPPDIQQKIRDGQVGVGFTPEQVRMAVGEPGRRYTQQTAAGTAEIWAYSKTGPTLSFGLGVGTFGSGVGGGVGVGSSSGNSDDALRVTFIDGKVTAVERTR